MTTTTVLDLAQPARAAAAVDALNDRLAAEAGVAPEVAARVAALADAVRATPLERWTAADPYLALLVHRAVLDARAAADDAGARRAADRARAALPRARRARRGRGGRRRADAEGARALARRRDRGPPARPRGAAGRRPAPLPALDLGARADPARGRGGAADPRAGAARRPAPARLHARGRARVVRLAAARAGRRDAARAARRPGPPARPAARGGLDAEHRVRVTVAYRLASWRRPLRTEPSRVAGRFHRMTEESPTQYLCLHPLGPWAEFVRALGARDARAARAGQASDLGAARRPRRAAADRLRRGAPSTACGPATSCPTTSAPATGSPTGCARRACRARSCRALRCPGTENVVLFGERAAAPYLVDPLSAVDVPSLAHRRRRPPAARACSSGSAAAARRTPGLEAWRAGEPLPRRRAELGGVAGLSRAERWMLRRHGPSGCIARRGSERVAAR